MTHCISKLHILAQEYTLYPQNHTLYPHITHCTRRLHTVPPNHTFYLQVTHRTPRLHIYPQNTHLPTNYTVYPQNHIVHPRITYCTPKSHIVPPTCWPCHQLTDLATGVKKVPNTSRFWDENGTLNKLSFRSIFSSFGWKAAGEGSAREMSHLIGRLVHVPRAGFAADIKRGLSQSPPNCVAIRLQWPCRFFIF